MDKENVRVYVAKASMELRLDRKIDAMETLRHAVKLNGYDGQHFTMLGTLELELGNVEESLIILKEGAEKYPGDQFLLQRWGTLEADVVICVGGSAQKDQIAAAFKIISDDARVKAIGAVGGSDAPPAVGSRARPRAARRPRPGSGAACSGRRSPST